MGVQREVVGRLIDDDGQSNGSSVNDANASFAALLVLDVGYWERIGEHSPAAIEKRVHWRLSITRLFEIYVIELWQLDAIDRNPSITNAQ